MLTEKPFQMPKGDLGNTRKLVSRNWVLYSLLHPTDDAEKRRVRDAKTFSQRHSLRTRSFANMGLQEPLANSHRQLCSLFSSNHSVHHV